MFEMSMLLGFVYAAFCHLLPLSNRWRRSVEDERVLPRRPLVKPLSSGRSSGEALCRSTGIHRRPM